MDELSTPFSAPGQSLGSGLVRIIGIDPGLQTTGYGVVEDGPQGIRVLEAGVLRPEKGEKDLGERLFSLAKGLRSILKDFQPTEGAMEQLYAHYQHPRTAILMGHARGVFTLELHQGGCRLTSYLPTNIKKTVTNHGRASKEQMQISMMRELGLSRLPEPADVADALAVALCHVFHLRRRNADLQTNATYIKMPGKSSGREVEKDS